MGSRDKALAIVREQMGVLFAPGLDTLVDVAIDDVVDKLLAIGRAQGLREAAGLTAARCERYGLCDVEIECRRRAEKAERGDG